jgi:serine phosphatase RsbU (regulator of sigma subunit)
MPVGPPVGRSLGLRGRRGASLDLPRGGLVALFTDGLVERRGVDVDARLDAVLEAVEHAPPEWVCAKVMATMVGTTAATDDIALLVARHTPEPTA